jgi:hypothetical protein
MPETLTGLLSSLRLELLPPVIAKGHPKESDLGSLDALADQIREKHQSSGLIKE